MRHGIQKGVSRWAGAAALAAALALGAAWWRLGPHTPPACGALVSATAPAGPITGAVTSPPALVTASGDADGHASAASVASQDETLVLALAQAARAEKMSLVFAVPATALHFAGSNAAGGARVGAIASRLGATVVHVGAVTVLKPAQYQPVDKYEAAYWKAMAGLADFIESLPAAQHKAENQEEWLDVKAQPEAQQSRLMAVLAFGDEPPFGAGKLRAAGAAAAGFIFDPYIEVTPVGGAPWPRYFFRTPYRLNALKRLEPGSVPGTLRGAYTSGGAER